MTSYTCDKTLATMILTGYPENISIWKLAEHGALRKSAHFIHRARQLYNNISMLFLFPVKDGKLSIGVNATFNASCYG